MNTYADTSVLFSLYAPDSNTKRADDWRTANPAPLPFTVFHKVELRNALRLAVFQNRLTSHEIKEIWKDVEQDIADGSLIVRGGHWHRVLVKAEGLSASHTETLGARTLDIIHVASATLMNLDEFCTFDPRQARMAVKAGLVVPVL